MGLSKIIVDSLRCKGCYLCIDICPKKAIQREEHVNEKGYFPIRVDEEKCVACGSCYRICPDYVFEILERE